MARKSASSTLLTTAAGVALIALPAAAQDPHKPAIGKLNDWKSANVEVVGHVLEPKQLEPSEDRLARLHLPVGFEITFSRATSSTHA
jgi:hypothetical protein